MIDSSETDYSNSADIEDSTEETQYGTRTSVGFRLYKAKHIDEAQFVAYMHISNLCDRARVGPEKALDPSGVIVDTSGVSNTISDVAADAMDELNKIAPILGRIDYSIVRTICGENLDFEEVSKRMFSKEEVTDREKKYIGKRFRDSLDLIALHIGASGVGRKRGGKIVSNVRF